MRKKYVGPKVVQLHDRGCGFGGIATVFKKKMKYQKILLEKPRGSSQGMKVSRGKRECKPF